MAREFLTFLAQIARNPAQVSAIAPSSQALAREMVRHLPAHGQGPVVELGPGTGVFTRAILASGIPPQDMHLVEANPRFAALLAQKFPGVRVHHAMAQDVPGLIDAPARAVLSGLPLRSMNPVVQAQIAQAAFAVLAHGAPFIQFTYGPKVPFDQKVRESLGLSWVAKRRIWWNLPPARVYVFSQR